MPVPCISIDKVSFRYGASLVLDRVSFGLWPGEMVGIVGPNGSGKTTLIKLLSGVMKPCSGEITIGQKSLREISRRYLARTLAVVSQSPTLPPSFSVADVVVMGRTPHLGLLESEGAHDWAAVRRAMTVTDTLDLAERRVGELSGGERQRVVIARALAQEPEVLLLDEPTAHLDISHQLAVLDLVRRLNQESGLAVAAVFHDLTLAAQYCNHLVMLCGGRVFAEGTAEEVITASNVSQVYGARLSIMAHPANGRPMVAAAATEPVASERRSLPDYREP